MGERFNPEGPKDPDQQSGQTEHLSPEEIEAIKIRKIEEMRKGVGPLEEGAITIQVDPDATMADLFGAIGKTGERVSRAERESGRFALALWSKFTAQQFLEILALEDKIWRAERKLPGALTEEDRELLALKVVDFFQSKGIPPPNIGAYLPVKFKKGGKPQPA